MITLAVAATAALLVPTPPGTWPPTPGTIPGRITAPLSAEGRSKVEGAIALIQANPQFGITISPDSIDVVEENSPGTQGSHDNDTVSVDTDALSVEAVAAVLVHELTHQAGANAAGLQFDPNDRWGPDALCYHASLYGTMAFAMCDFIAYSAGGPSPGTCADLDHAVGTMSAVNAELLGAGAPCPPHPSPDPAGCGC